MRAFLLTSLLAVGLGLPAFAQVPAELPTANPLPDESWVDYPGPEAVPPPAESMPPPPLPPSPGGQGERVVASAGPLAPSRVSLYGARVLEPGRVAAGIVIGFPLVSAQLSVGVLPRLDLGVGADSLYGIMNELRAYARYGLVQGEEGQLALSVDGGHAFFLNPPSREEFGARYFTGRRNWNLAPGLVGSLLVGKRSRGFLDVRYLITFDTQPFQRVPLGGAPEGVQVGGNFLFRAGLEVPFSERTSYVVTVGGNIHGRPEDAAFMPVVGIGVVAGIL
jgi:hypothetical protein